MLNEVRVLLNIAVDDMQQFERLEIIYNLINRRVLSYIDEQTLPESLEWVVVEATIKRFNRLGNEHLNSASVEGISTSYSTEDILAEYKSFLDGYLLSKSEPKKASAKKVRLL